LLPTGQCKPESRLRLAVLLFLTLILGIVTRKLHLGVMLWDKSAGDVLYAVAVYFAIAMIFPQSSRLAVALLAMTACVCIELFQLTGIPLALYRTRYGHWAHWILGSTFAWHDVFCYAVGVPLAALVHRFTETAFGSRAAH
jgi:hypothetical protein